MGAWRGNWIHKSVPEAMDTEVGCARKGQTKRPGKRNVRPRKKTNPGNALRRPNANLFIWHATMFYWMPYAGWRAGPVTTFSAERSGFVFKVPMPYLKSLRVSGEACLCAANL